MLILENILSQEIVQRLGWTLVHFIWQAMVIALILAILLRVLRKSTANLRYIFACLALGLIVLLPVITIKLVPVSVPHLAAHIEPVPAPTVLPTVKMPASETIVLEEPLQPESVTLMPAVSWKQHTIKVFEPALPYIVSGWLLGVFGLSLWHLGGWTQLQRLKRRMVKQVDGTLNSKLRVLAQRLRVSRTVQLMESALVQIPTVVGWLRPMILLPASALTGLSSEQLEAILAHELAHIRRCDYLINILQTIVEILGFYHPAVWWVSHKIRAERENCCDDLAVSISGDRVCYARALTSMEEIRAGHGQLAVAAGGANLFKRIYRLLGKDSAEKTGFSWITAATVILLILALVIPTALALTNKSNPQQSEPKTNVPVESEEALEPVQIKELLEIEKRVESAKKLSNLSKALLIYTNDHEDKYPLSLRRLRDYLNLGEFDWALANIEYLAHGKTIAVRPDTVIAYDKILLTERKGTNVLYNDSHVEFVKPERLKELGISATKILIETQILLVSEDFLQSIGLDANSVHSSDLWAEQLAAKYAAEPNAETYSLILDDLHISFLLRAVQAHKGATMLAAPQVMVHEDRTAEIGIMTEEYYVLGYTEPNHPSDKPVPKADKVKLGTRLWLKPELTSDNEKIKLDFKMEIRQLLGYEERKYKGKYIYMIPRTEVVSTKMPCLIHDGKTLLIGGLKITDKVSAAPILSRLPVIGELFRSRDKTRAQKILLILVKPTINPQQRAKKILPGQEDSEEHTKSLASQLEEKLNPPADLKTTLRCAQG